MKNKWGLVCYAVQLLIGLAAIMAFVVLAVNGEEVYRWVLTLALATASTAIGAAGIISYFKEYKTFSGDIEE